VTAAGRSAWARWWPAGLAWALWMVALLGVATIPWFDHLLRQAGRPELTQLHAITLPSVVAALIAVTVGAVLADRRPRHPVGWLMLVLGLAVTASGVVDGYARYGLLARPGALPAARWLAVFSPATLYLGFVSLAWCCCSPRADRCHRPAGAGGPGWWRPDRSSSCWRWRSGLAW
jgi:UDP-N-acetylmuramyl pentapeptide phosphotransferase/UDP-N-acetylglucosamine-1-phosphate transferase